MRRKNNFQFNVSIHHSLQFERLGCSRSGLMNSLVLKSERVYSVSIMENPCFLLFVYSEENIQVCNNQ